MKQLLRCILYGGVIVSLVCCSAADAKSLRRATATTIRIPAVPDTDGTFLTLHTGALDDTDIEISKDGGPFASKSDTTDPTYIDDGEYSVPLNATDTTADDYITVRLVHDDACPWHTSYDIEGSNWANSRKGTDYLQVDPVQWNGTNVATPDTAGYPKVTIKDGTGAGELNLTSGVVDADAVKLSTDSAAADALETMLDGTGGQTLSLAKLAINSSAAGGAIDIDNSAGPGIHILTTGTNQDGIYVMGNGTGDGIYSSGGAGGGAGLRVTTGGANGHGIWTSGGGTGHGIYATGGGSGDDINADISGALSGSVGSVTAGVNLADDAITSAKYDQSTAFPQTGDSYARLGAPAGASVSADIATVDGNVDTILGRVPAEVAQKQHLVNGTGDITPPTNIGIWDVLGNGTKSISGLNDISPSQVNAECDTALTDYDAVVPADLPSNFADLAITPSTGRISIGTNYDKSGYSISGTKQTLDALNDISPATVNAQCDTALSDIHLDDLFEMAIGTPDWTAGSLMSDLVEDNGGTLQYKSNALLQGWVACAVALDVYHLDDLFETAVSTPDWTAGSIMGDLLQDNGSGTLQYTSTALQNAPTGGDDAATIWAYTGGSGRTLTNGVNVTAISGSTTAADNAELFFDNTGFAASNSSIGSVSGNVGGNVVGTIGGFTTTAKDEIENELDDSIETYHLDEFFETAATVGGWTTDSLGYHLLEDVSGVRFRSGALSQAWTVTNRTITAPTNITSSGNAIQLHTDDKVLLAGTTHTGAVIPTVSAVTGSVGSVTAGVTLADDAITSAKFDESSAFPLGSADSGSTQIARAGADGDTLETLSDQIDGTALASVCTDSRLSELDSGNVPTDIDTLLGRLTSSRAGYLDKLNVTGTLAHSDAAATYKADVSNLDVAISTRLAASAAPPNWGDLDITASTGRISVGTSYDKSGYSLAADQSSVTIGTVTTVTNTIDADLQEILGHQLTQTGTQLADGFQDFFNVGTQTFTSGTAASWFKADVSGLALASVCSESRLGELDAANLPADMDTLLSRLSAARAGYLDKLNVSGTLAHSNDASTYKADVSNLDTTVSSRATQAQITGGSYSLDTDPNGRIRIVSGTGAGELNVTSGVVDSNIVQIKGSTNAGSVMYAMYSGACVLAEVDDTSPSSTSFVTTLTSTIDGLYNDQYITFVEGALNGQTRKIHPTSGYNGTTKAITVANAFSQAPADNDDFVILGRSE